jgi:hypothetical protein
VPLPTFVRLYLQHEELTTLGQVIQIGQLKRRVLLKGKIRTPKLAHAPSKVRLLVSMASTSRTWSACRRSRDTERIRQTRRKTQRLREVLRTPTLRHEPRCVHIPSRKSWKKRSATRNVTLDIIIHATSHATSTCTTTCICPCRMPHAAYRMPQAT